MSDAPATILIVDGDSAEREVVRRRLTRRGFAVRVAASGREALGVIAEHPVALVLLDAQLEDMSGLEALQAIRTTQSSARLPVLMVTSKDRFIDMATALDLGANDHIAKPVDWSLALARIQTQLMRQQAEERLRESEERYALAAAGANDGLWDWKITTNEVHFSARWKAIIGFDAHEIGSGLSEWFDRVHPEDLPRLRRNLDAHLAGHTPHFENEHRMRHRNGAFRWVLTRALAVRNAEGIAVRVAGSQSDITEGKVVDALTGLPNRMLLIDRLERVLQHHRLHPGAQFALLLLDLDGFKVVNDNLGHAAGDELLQAVARRLEGSLRAGDTVLRPAGDGGVLPLEPEHTLARMGGDEFLLLLDSVRGVIDATRVADRIQRALARPFQAGGREISTTASIGIAVSGTGYARPEELLRDADTAMYRAKALGKGRSEVFDGVMREQVQERARLDAAVRLGLERHEFMPYYQPIIDLQTGRLAGFEALLRWRHPDRGIVSPSEFVPLIEENGLVMPIGRRFFQDVCQQIRTWRDAFPEADQLWINVNFASQQFLEADLPTRLLECLDEAGIGPDHIVVEITESTAIANFALTYSVLQELRTAGIRVMLDDFGTGFSSLACLHKLPISGIKLDPTFIAAEHDRPEILKAVVGLAESLGLSVTAEGIETIEQCNRMRALACGYAQGYLFARPLDAAGAAAAIGARRAWLPEALSSAL